jgi:replication factor C small subunit
MVAVDSQIWVEKYRPETLDDVVGNDVVVRRMQEWVDDNTFPNVMLYGPQGTGKTTIAASFVKDKYGEEWNQHFLQLNASDDRGIDVVRDQIKEFAQLSTISDYQFKVVFLDEADALTKSAQPALRRVMEDYSDRTRFILSCNYPNQLIDPIQSRCSAFSVDRLDSAQMMNLLEKVAEGENVDYEKDQLEELVEISEGDARAAIHSLQTSVMNGEIDDGVLAEITLPAQIDDVGEVVDLAITGEADEAMTKLGKILESGISAQELCNLFLSQIQNHDGLPEDSRTKMIDKVAETEWRVLNGSNPHVQFNSLIADLRVARFMSLDRYREENQEV